MSLETVLQNFLTFAGTFDLHLVILLLVICSVGEFGAHVPYLLETIWLSTGYHLGIGALSPFNTFLLWLTAQTGRQAGVTALFYMSRLGSTPLMRVYRHFFKDELGDKSPANDSWPMRFWRKLNLLSPLSVAVGRLLWFRIPLTVVLGIRKQLKALTVGVLLSGIAWDGIYILLGVIGGKAYLTPTRMILYSLGGLTLVYLGGFALQRLLKKKPAPST